MLFWIIVAFVGGFVLPLLLSIKGKEKTDLDMFTNVFMVKNFYDSDIEIDDVKFSETDWIDL